MTGLQIFEGFDSSVAACQLERLTPRFIDKLKQYEEEPIIIFIPTPFNCPFTYQLFAYVKLELLKYLGRSTGSQIYFSNLIMFRCESITLCLVETEFLLFVAPFLDQREKFINLSILGPRIDERMKESFNNIDTIHVKSPLTLLNLTDAPIPRNLKGENFFKMKAARYWMSGGRYIFEYTDFSLLLFLNPMLSARHYSAVQDFDMVVDTLLNLMFTSGQYVAAIKTRARPLWIIFGRDKDYNSSMLMAKSAEDDDIRLIYRCTNYSNEIEFYKVDGMWAQVSYDIPSVVDRMCFSSRAQAMLLDLHKLDIQQLDLWFCE